MEIKGFSSIGQNKKLFKQPPLPRKVPDPNQIWQQRTAPVAKGKTIWRNSFGDWAEITR